MKVDTSTEELFSLAEQWYLSCGDPETGHAMARALRAIVYERETQTVVDEKETQHWKLLYQRMRNVAAGYSNFVDDGRLEKEFDNIEKEARQYGQ